MKEEEENLGRSGEGGIRGSLEKKVEEERRRN